jgi:hypothetical protein
VDEGTPDLPFGTVFQPSTWLDVPEGEWPVGEVPGAERTWVDGSPPFPVAGDGHVCGTADDFAGHAAYPFPVPLLNDFGGLRCCPTPDPPFVHRACDCFPDGAWSDYILIVTGGTGTQWGNSNGVWRLTWRGAFDPAWGQCNWVSPVPFQYGMTGDTFWAIQQTDALHPCTSFSVIPYRALTGFGASWPLPAWDVMSLRRAPVIAGAGPPGFPPSVIVLPGIPPLDGDVCLLLGHSLPSTASFRAPRTAGLGYSLREGDYNLLRTGRCTYQGTVWWGLARFGLPIRLRIPTTCYLSVQPGPVILLELFTPLGSRVPYTLSGDWDGENPIGLLRGPSPAIGGVPLAVTLFDPDNPP